MTTELATPLESTAHKIIRVGAESLIGGFSLGVVAERGAGMFEAIDQHALTIGTVGGVITAAAVAFTRVK